MCASCVQRSQRLGFSPAVRLLLVRSKCRAQFAYTNGTPNFLPRCSFGAVRLTQVRNITFRDATMYSTMKGICEKFCLCMHPPISFRMGLGQPTHIWRITIHFVQAAVGFAKLCRDCQREDGCSWLALLWFVPFPLSAISQI